MSSSVDFKYTRRTIDVSEEKQSGADARFITILDRRLPFAVDSLFGLVIGHLLRN